jgi:hypothetical protein
VSDDGVYCHEWVDHFEGVRRCYRWLRAKRNRYRMLSADRFRTGDIPVWRIESGLQ